MPTATQCERELYEARQRYADAARRLRAYIGTKRHSEPAVLQHEALLLGAATALEAAGYNLPAGRLERAAVDSLAMAVDRLPV